jgi:hypothetical protein
LLEPTVLGGNFVCWYQSIEKPPQSARKSANLHDLRPQQPSAWRHQARQGRLALPAAELSFVPVAGGADALSAETSAAPAGLIEVGGAVVRVPPELDGKLLAKVLRAVKAVT